MKRSVKLSLHVTIFKHGQRNILTMCVSKWRL